MLYAKISKPSNRVILHLMDVQTHGEERTPLANPAEVVAFIRSHPEVEAVMFYDSRAPRKAVDVAKVDERFLRKFFRVAR